MTTALGLIALPQTAAAPIGAKPLQGVPVLGTRIREFDTWRPGYATSVVEVLRAGTTTLAPLFADPFLTTPLPNPQALVSQTDDNGVGYGKFAKPVYTYVSYELLIDQTNTTGVEQPALTALDGEDVSVAIAESLRGGYPLRIADFMDRDVDATMFGSLSEADGSETCTITLAAAIGAAAAQGGGDVLLPPLNIPILAVTLPQGVILRGKGPGPTVLRSTVAGVVVTLGGDGAGLADLTLDGLDLVPQSIGVYGVGLSSIVFDNVLLQRFETGVRVRGGLSFRWRDFAVSNCTNCLDLRGDSDSAATSAGSEFSDLLWDGGSVSFATGYGLFLEFFDQPVRDCWVKNVTLSSCTADALRIQGARGITFDNCQWVSCTSDISILDGSNPAYVSTNTSERIRFDGGTINGGSVTFNQTCLDVQFRGTNFENVSLVATVPTNTIMFVDCIWDAQTTQTGDTAKIMRQSTESWGSVTAVTTDGNTLNTWSRAVDPGGTMLISARAIARRRDGVTYGIFWCMAGVNRPGASMAANSVTTLFTVGLVLKGQTSGASARITAVSGSGGTATMTLRDIVGTFISGEVIQDTSSGIGRFVGSLGYSDVVLDATGATNLRAPTITGTGWTCVVAVGGGLVAVQIKGETGAIIEWTIDVEVTEP